MRNLLIALSVVILFLMFVTASHGQCPCANGRCPTFSATVTIPPAPAVAPAPMKPAPPAAKDGGTTGSQVCQQAPADRGTRWYPGKRVARWVRGR